MDHDGLVLGKFAHSLGDLLQWNKVRALDGLHLVFFRSSHVEKHSVPTLGLHLAKLVNGDVVVGRIHGTAMAFVAQSFKTGIVATENAVRILAKLDGAKAGAQSVIANELPKRRLPNF